MAFKLNVSKKLENFISEEEISLISPRVSASKFWKQVQNELKINIENDDAVISIKDLDKILQKQLLADEVVFTVRDLLFLVIKSSQSNDLERIFSLVNKLKDRDKDSIDLIQEEKTFLLDNLKTYNFDPILRASVFYKIQNEIED